MAETVSLQIAIIGAGIAGLTAAIALKNHPAIDVHIYERAAELQEIGASIALGPNGMRTLDRLGVHNALDESVAFRNKSGRPMIYRHWQTNEVVSADTHRGHVDYRHLTSRFYRAHLQQELVRHIDPSRIHTSKSFQSIAFSKDKSGAKKLVISFADGTKAMADILLGADGIHSPVRSFFVPDSTARWTGGVAFRSVFPISHVAHIPDLPAEATHFWGPDRALFISKLGKDLFTVVALLQNDTEAADAPYKDATWNSEGDMAVLRKYYRNWSHMTRSIIDATPHTRIYPNVAGRGIDTWVLGEGRVTLAGDAAHAHGGAFAAGGSLAIDDAWAFAAAVSHVFPPEPVPTRLPTDAEIITALRLYEATRKPHTDKIIQIVHSLNTNKAARTRGKLETDQELRARMKNRGDSSWIHEHDVQGTFWGVLAAENARSLEEQARL